MSDIEGKLKAINSRFRHNSKQWNAARFIVRQDHEITTEERKALIKEIPIAYGSLTGLITELRNMGLYPPQETSDVPKLSSPPEKPQETSPKVPEAPQLPLHLYMTKKDFETQFETLRKSTNETLETLKDSVNNLASLFNKDPPLNPGENDEEGEEETEMFIPREMIPPGELIIQEGSSKREIVFIKPITQLYYDFTRSGSFRNYPGSSVPGPFDYQRDEKGKFLGSISDFFDIITNEFFNNLYLVDISVTDLDLPMGMDAK